MLNMRMIICENVITWL